jgi:3-phosphoshikimate 1-carboxyvinyltransferase
MDRIVQPLRLMGADVRGRDGDTKAPLTISGRRLQGLRYRLPVASAQVKSALMLAALYAEGETALEEPGPSRDHSERMLTAMGAEVRFGEGMIRVRPLSSELRPLSLRVPGDLSAAAAWLVAAILHPDAELRLEGVGVNPSRSGLIDALRLMGADVRLEDQRTWGCEPVADLVVRSSRLRGVLIEGDLIPRVIDELPLLALAACLAEGETVIQDAAELRLKESDRIRVTVRELRRLGADIEELDDGMRVRGVGGLRGAAVSSHGDHRIAMLLAVAGIVAQGETDIGNSQAVAVSYPKFWNDLEYLLGVR